MYEHLKLIMFLVISLSLMASWYVRVEPAPCDYLFSIAFVIWLFSRKPLNLKKQDCYVLVPFAGFLGASVGSLLVSPTFSAGRYLFITVYLCCTSVFFADLVIRHGNKARTLIMGALSVAGFIASVTSYFGQLGVPWFSWAIWGENRAVAGFKDPNVYGAFLVPLAMFGINKLRWAQKWENFGWGIFSAFTISGVILSLSRGALINSIVTGLSYLVLSPRLCRNHILKLGAMLFGVLILISTVFAIRPQILSTSTQRVGLMPYDEERFEKQRLALYLISRHPFGIGPGQSESVLQYATHNTYLRVGLENGWLALFCFIAFILISLLFGLQAIRKTSNTETKDFKAAVVASLIGTLANGFFIDTLHWRHFWWLLGMTIGMAREYKEEIHSKPCGSA